MSGKLAVLILRRQVFLDLIGDRAPDKYFPRDLQAFVNKMQHFPSNVSKRTDVAGMSTHQILEANKDFTIAPAMAKKTMTDGYVANSTKASSPFVFFGNTSAFTYPDWALI